MKIQQSLEYKITQSLSPSFLEVLNESFMHNVPAGSESHFKITVVSNTFKEMLPLERHRHINRILSQELKEDIHALSLHAFTPEEWAAKKSSPQSPPCLGGSNTSHS